MNEGHPTVREWQSWVAETRKRLMQRSRRIWPEGDTRTCPRCKKKTLIGRSDLTREVDATGVVIVFSNLHGAVCESCGTEYLEGYEQQAIEERAGTAFRGHLTGTVSALGGKKLGTYWPKDVQRALNLHAKDDLQITPLAPDTAVMRVVHRHDDKSVEEPEKGD